MLGQVYVKWFFGSVWLVLVQFGPDDANFGLVWLKFGSVWLKFGSIWSILAQFGPNLAQFGPFWLSLVQFWLICLDLAQFWQSGSVWLGFVCRFL